MYKYLVKKAGVVVVESDKLTTAIANIAEPIVNEEDDDFEIERINSETGIAERFCYDDPAIDGRWITIDR